VCSIVLFYKPVRISIEAASLEVMLTNPDHVIERMVVINGTYRRRIRDPHIFRGEIKISGYPDINFAASQDLRLSQTILILYPV